jgi:hypothetical protein
VIDTNTFPIGIWNYTPIGFFDEARIEEWKDCGLTMPISPYFSHYLTHTPEDAARMRQVLRWAEERDIRTILADPRVMDYRNPNYAENVRRAAEEFGDSPAVAAFHVTDEPRKDEWQDVAHACRVVREVAPNIRPFVNQLPWHPGVESLVGFERFDDFLDAFVRESGVDLLCYDCYFQMLPNGEGLPLYWRNLVTYREAALRHKLPFWNTILSVGHFHYRCPSEDDVRWQFNTSIAYGAKGILYFFFYMRQPHENYRLAPIDEFGERTPLYYTLRRINRGFLRKWGALMLGLTNVSVSHWAWTNSTAVGTRLWQPSAILKRVDADRRHLILSEFVDGQGRPYVMVVNDSTTESTHAVLGLAGAGTRAYWQDWNGNEAQAPVERAEGLSFVSQWLAPGQMEIWRVDAA